MCVGKPRKKETYMSKATRKALAIVAGAALGASSLVGLPAQAAPYSVDIAPESGSNWSVFNEDTFSVEFSNPTLITSSIVDANWSMVISNPDSVNLTLDFEGVADTQTNYKFTYVLSDATGVSNSAVTANYDAGTPVSINFASTSEVSAVLYAFADLDGSDANPVAAAPSVVNIARSGAAHGDDGAAISLQAWVDSNADVEDVDAGTASEVETITFIDPATVSVITKLERSVADGASYLNEHSATHVAGSVRFSKVVNLDQTDFTSWDWDVATNGTVAGANADVTPVADLYDGVTSHDSAGKALLTFPVNSGLVGGSDYQVRVVYDGETRVFSSAAFEVVEASNADIDGVELAVEEDENILDNTSGAIDVRTGTASVTLVAQIDDGGTDVEAANQPVVVVVTASEGTAAVSGVAGAAAEGESKIWNTLTNADGQVEITVTSSAVEGDEYVVTAYLLDTNGNDIVTSQAFTFTYVDAAVTSWETNSTVLTGTSLTLSASVEDQFGEPISVDTEGDAIQVGFIATDADNLDEYVAVVAGSASVTFTNWLAEGESDVLTVSAHTGDEDDRTNLSGTLADISVTLYADLEVTAVTTTSAEVDATVGYYDFGSATGAGLVSGDKGTINGTVIDAVGAGVPGAQVTVAGDGLQFKNGSDYAVGTLTFSADEAGTFVVDVWTHVADDVDVTITSGGESATVTVAGALDSGAAAISAQDLVLSWNIPATPVFNTTYAVVASVTDVWGNPIANAEVTFAGEAAAQFNSDADVAKDTNRAGKATAYLRSLADVSGLAAVSLTLTNNIDHDGDGTNDITDVGGTFSDDENTSWDESAATGAIAAELNFLTSAPVTTTQKVNAGSFKGFVAVYARGYEGQRLSAKIGNDWVIVPSIVNNQENGTLFRATDFTGAGVNIAVRIYIDRVLVDTINLVTK
jgi:hypothetical protein